VNEVVNLDGDFMKIQGRLVMSLTLCRIGSGFDSNFWGKSNLEFGQIWSTAVGLEFFGGLALQGWKYDCSSL
jgi:hypothetical protein